VTADRLTLRETADRFGVGPTAVRKRLDAGQFPGAAKDARGRWTLDPVEVETVTGWTRKDTPAPTPTPRDTPGNALVLLDQIAPLLQRVANAERERADAEARARIAEHRADTAATAVRLPWWVAAALVMVGALVGGLGVAVALG
jgi:hypothetical protein